MAHFATVTDQYRRLLRYRWHDGQVGFDFSSLFWAAGILGVLTLMMRWVFAPSKRPHTGRPQIGADADHGLLVPVLHTSRSEALAVKNQLIAQGIRSSVSRLAADRYQVMVFRVDQDRARAVVHGLD